MLKILKSIFEKKHSHIQSKSLKKLHIALYFGGSMENIYQLTQWLPILVELEKKERIEFIVRDAQVYFWLQSKTKIASVFCQKLSDLTKVYEENNFKCILYVNHGFKNFQSLMHRHALHIHINHGESEKISTISNQVNAYNYVFIVGDAAFNKYKFNLLKRNMNTFISIGRPQLEHIKMHQMRLPKDKKIILYAPTWEGTHTSMNYTSLNQYGLEIVNHIINNSDFYLIYKPHPNTGSRDSTTNKINQNILKVLQKNNNGHSILDTDINSIFTHVDIGIFDNSAAAIDYLYFDKPIIMTDMFHRDTHRQCKPTITQAVHLLSSANLTHLTTIINNEIIHDPLQKVRNNAKKYFLGNYDYSQNESTARFISSILNICKERDTLILKLQKMNNKVHLDDL